MLKIAGVQFSGHTKRELNLEKITRYVTEAARNGARVVCLPELSTSIYFCWESNYSHFDYAEPVPGPSTEEVSALAKRVEATVVFPLFERAAEGQYYNTAVVVSSRGELIGKYRKNSIPLSIGKDGHIAANEKMYFQPGNLGFPVFRIPEGLTVGLLICYDRHFPEGARIIGLGGADILFVPTNAWRAPMKDIWEVELRAHAVANVYYVCGVNKVGKDEGGSPNHFFFGTSLVVGPMGQVIARAGDQADEIMYADLDLAQLAEAKRMWPMFRDRRPDAYGPISTPA
jgi:N-carbamoylputrescine amidase